MHPTGILKRAAALGLTLAAVGFFGGMTAIAAGRTFSDGLAAYDAGRYQEAFETWQALAFQDYPQAIAALANLHARGEGTPKNFTLARNFYRQAALAGDAVAQLNLAEYLEEGRGGERDRVAALIWYELAATRGRRWAGRQAERLRGRLDAEALELKEERKKLLLRDFPDLR